MKALDAWVRLVHQWRGFTPSQRGRVFTLLTFDEDGNRRPIVHVGTDQETPTSVAAALLRELGHAALEPRVSRQLTLNPPPPWADKNRGEP